MLLRTITLFLFFVGITAHGQVNQTDSKGKKQGFWKKPYPSSNVFQYVGQFKDDLPYGQFTYYYESGKTKIILDYKDARTSYAKMYHETGYLMARGKYIDQKKDSTWVTYDDRGVISYQEDYKSGLLNGQRVVFYEPQAGQYKVMEYSYWKNGIQHGEYKKYHPNSKLAEEGNYIDGNRDGQIKYYHPNGKVSLIANFQFAVRHGFQTSYDEKGVQIGYKFFWYGEELKGEAMKKKIIEYKASNGN